MDPQYAPVTQRSPKQVANALPVPATAEVLEADWPGTGRYWSWPASSMPSKLLHRSMMARLLGRSPVLVLPTASDTQRPTLAEQAPAVAIA